MPFKIDRRSRRDEEQQLISPSTFFVQNFLRLTDTRRRIIAEGMKALNTPPLTSEVGESAWTIARMNEQIDYSKWYARRSVDRLTHCEPIFRTGLKFDCV